MPAFSIPERWRRPAAGVAVLGVAGLAVLAALSLSLVAVTDARLDAAEQASQQDGEARRLLHAALADFSEAEAAERGYLLTDDAALLRPLHGARQELDQAMTALADSPRWSAAGRAGLAALVGVIGEQTAGLDRAVALHDAGQRDAALALVRAAGAGALADRMRSLVAGLTDDLAVQSAADARAEQRDGMATFLVAAGSVLFAVMVMLTAGIVVVAQSRAHRRSEAALRAARESAEANNRAKSRFLAAVSHDLRQPLHAIVLFVAALRRRITGEETTSLLDHVAAAAGDMQRMFSALLDVARLDAGAVVVQPRSFDLEEMLQLLRARFAPLAAAKGLRLSAPENHLLVWSDPALLESILRNLLANAVAYSERGSVGLSVRRVDQVLEIAVQDSGPGIAADRLAGIFDEFVRLDDADPTGHHVGLGLAIVRRLADLLGARVGVESSPGEGSVFTVRLPFVPGEAAVAPHDEAAGVPDLTGARILVLDDDPLVLRATAAEVTAWGAEPLLALGAAEVVGIMERMAPDAPDGAIIDQNIIGEVSGVALLDQIAARFGVALPSVVVTGATTAEAREELTDSGHPWLLKPADPVALRRTLAVAVAEARRLPPRPAGLAAGQEPDGCRC